MGREGVSGQQATLRKVSINAYKKSAGLKFRSIGVSGTRMGAKVTYHVGRNAGSFKTRAGGWKKGKGGRFVGSK